MAPRQRPLALSDDDSPYADITRAMDHLAEQLRDSEDARRRLENGNGGNGKNVGRDKVLQFVLGLLSTFVVAVFIWVWSMERRVTVVENTHVTQSRFEPVVERQTTVNQRIMDLERRIMRLEDRP